MARPAVGLAVLGVLIAWSLFKAHDALDATERDRLRVQARVVDDNVGQQLDGMNRAIASVRDEFLATPVHSVSTLLSVRMKALSRRHPRRSLDGAARRRRHGRREQRRHAARPRLRRPRLLPCRAQRPRTRRCTSRAPLKTPLGNWTVIFVRAIFAPNGSFVGAVAAALEPEYFKVLMRSVLYAPDMWVSLGHGDGKVFVTMPEDARRVEGESQPAFAAIGKERSGANDTPDRSRPDRRLERSADDRARPVSPPSLHMDKPLVIAVSRAMPELFAPWRQQAFAVLTFFALLGAGAAFGLYRGQWRRKSYALLEASAERERRTQRRAARAGARGRRAGPVGLGRAQRPLQPQRSRPRASSAMRPDELGDSCAAWRNLVHRDDAERLISTIEAHFRRETAAYECEFRVRHKDGHWVWLLSRGKVVERDADDTPVRMAGTSWT